MSEIANKVPTRIAYGETGQVRSWGFGCDFVDGNVSLKEFFKLALDPTYREEWEGGMTHGEATKYYRDYLSQIHKHVAEHLLRSFPNWANQRVEWVFSVPTTWRNVSLINTLNELIKAAGFGRDGERHSCRISLTEAEAAAVFVAHQLMKVSNTRSSMHLLALTMEQKDDVIVVCDAGGGTTVGAVFAQNKRG